MPPPLLESPRLYLRQPEPGDAPALARICNNLDVVRWTSSHAFPYELSHAQEFIAKREQDYQDRKAVAFGAFLKDTHEMVGAVGLHNMGACERAELGYLIGPIHWGKGYATEIARRCITHAFADLNLSRLHAGVFSGNTPSARVLDKLGFQREGLQRRHICRFGTWHDLILYGMLREEWKG